MNLSYIINHLGEDREQYFNAVAPPIVQSSNFAFSDIEAMRKALQDEQNIPFYTRGCNPTVAILRKKMAALEKADDALIFGSGSAAMAAAVISQVKAGDHIICVSKPYNWTNKLLNQLLQRFGVEVSMVDGTDIANYANAIQDNTRLLIAESPNSITFELQDIEAMVALAKKHGLSTIIDNSYASPLYQQPIEMGIDLVVHSASKYLNGHSDIVAGVLCGSNALIQQIFQKEYMTLGGIISPHDAWLMLRGLRTLPIRLEKSHQSAMQITAFLAEHPAVSKVNFPFSPDFPQYELAKRQMSGSGGLFSIVLNTDSMEEVEAFCNRLRYFLMACSWGGHESLLFPMCALYSSQNYQSVKAVPWNLVRLYIGLEEPEVLINDLKEALAEIKPK